MLLCKKAGPIFSRLYSTSNVSNPPLKLVAELRKLTNVSITKAREALGANDNDVNASLKWLEKDLVTAGAKAAAKFSNRDARQGVVSVSILSAGRGTQTGPGQGGLRAGMVELNCETDFVGRNNLFSKLAADIAHTAAFIAEPSESDSEKILRPCSLELLNGAPLISQFDPQSQHSSTVEDAIRHLTSKVGEKINLRRALVVAQKPLANQPDLGLRIASYLHGSVNQLGEGRIGVLAILAIKSPNLPAFLSSRSSFEDLERLERSLARQIAGFDTSTIRSPTGITDECALYDQPIMLPENTTGQSVLAFLREWARKRGLAEKGDSQVEDILDILEFEKWTVGDLQ